MLTFYAACTVHVTIFSIGGKFCPVLCSYTLCQHVAGYHEVLVYTIITLYVLGFLTLRGGDLLEENGCITTVPEWREVVFLLVHLLCTGG